MGNYKDLGLIALVGGAMTLFLIGGGELRDHIRSIPRNVEFRESKNQLYSTYRDNTNSLRDDYHLELDKLEERYNTQLDSLKSARKLKRIIWFLN